MLSKFIRSLLILGGALILPLYAQTSKPAKPGTAIETMGTNPSTTTTVTNTTTTVTSVKTTTHKHRVMKAAHTGGKARVYSDATRLGSLLDDTQGKAMLTPAAWKSIANEANALSNALVGATSGNKTAHKAATDARTHVREMRTAALKGDADGAKTHAGLALPFVYTLIDWSTPAK